jgi:hypothetical protein
MYTHAASHQIGDQRCGFLETFYMYVIDLKLPQVGRGLGHGDTNTYTQG